MGLDMNYEAQVFVDTEDLSREDWLSYRRVGIGGSDAAAIMVLDGILNGVATAQSPQIKISP